MGDRKVGTPPHRRLLPPLGPHTKLRSSSGVTTINDPTATTPSQDLAHAANNDHTVNSLGEIPDAVVNIHQTNSPLNAWAQAIDSVTEQPDKHTWVGPSSNVNGRDVQPSGSFWPDSSTNHGNTFDTVSVNKQHANASWGQQLDGIDNEAATNDNTPPQANVSSRPNRGRGRGHGRGRGRKNRTDRKPSEHPPKPTQPKTKKRESPWISDKDIKAMNAAVTWEVKRFDESSQPDPHLFWAWEGEKAPAPIWDERLAYRNPNLNGSIKTWLGKAVLPENPLGQSLIRDYSNSHANNFSFTVNKSAVKGGHLFFLPPGKNESLIGDMVPRAWIPDVLEPGQSLQDFWKDQLRGSPKPQDEDDLTNWKPFWERYLSPDTGVQLPYQQPQHRGCDTSEDTPEDTQLRKQEKGSQGWIQEYQANPNAFMLARFDRKAGPSAWEKRAERQAQEQAEIEEAAKESDQKGPATSQGQEHVITPEPLAVEIVDNSIKPKVNVYIRMALPLDMPQVTTIYNHYIQESVCTPELKMIKNEDMLARFESARSTHLPFIVCCSRRAKNKGKKTKHALPADEVLGFAYADDYHNPRASLRFTVEVGVFVNPTKKRCGISKCLLDKLIGLLDQYHGEVGGYDVDDQLGLGVHRLVSRLIMNWLHVKDDEMKEWIVPYLKSWGFEEVGYMKGVAYKLDQVVDMKTFCRDTGLIIVPTNPPLAPLSDR